MEVQRLHEDWLSSNSQYRAAAIQMKDDKVVEQYDLGEQEMWEEAVRGSAVQVTAVKREVKQHVIDLQRERALVEWILQQLSAYRLSPSVALSRVEQSLTQVHGLAVMGDLQKTLEAAHAMSGGGGRGRLSALDAGKGGYGEFEEVAAILRELIADLTQRKHVFDRMVSSAQAHFEANTRNYAEWQEKLNTGAAKEERARAVMSSQEQRRHVLAGRLLVAQQQVDSLAEGFPAQAAMLSASFASYQRVVARLLEKARDVCAPVALEDQETEENLKEEDSLPKLMMQLRQRKREAKRLETLIRDTRMHSSRVAGIAGEQMDDASAPASASSEAENPHVPASELRRIKDAAKALLRAASPVPPSAPATFWSAPSSSSNKMESELLKSVQRFAEKAAAAGVLPPATSSLPYSGSVHFDVESAKDKLRRHRRSASSRLAAKRDEAQRLDARYMAEDALASSDPLALRHQPPWRHQHASAGH